jgi:hypothetical protein
MSTQPLPLVYAVGSGHTGSTLLAMLMDAHPQVASVGEIAVKPKIRRRGDSADQRCSCGAPFTECAFWGRVFRLVNEQGYDFGPTCWSNDYRIEHPFAHRLLSRDSSYPAVRRWQRWAARHLPVFRARVRHIDRVNVAFVRAVLQAKGADVFFDTSKQPMRLSHLLDVPEFDVKVVTLVRDVRGYAASAKRRGHSIADAARTWAIDQQIIRRITSSLPPGRTLLVRYEDLCARPQQMVAQLWQFCGVTPVEPVTTVRSNEHHVIGNNMRREGAIQVRLDESWRGRLAAAEERQILQIAGDLNRELGYQ